MGRVQNYEDYSVHYHETDLIIRYFSWECISIESAWPIIWGMRDAHTHLIKWFHFLLIRTLTAEIKNIFMTYSDSLYGSGWCLRDAIVAIRTLAHAFSLSRRTIAWIDPETKAKKPGRSSTYTSAHFITSRLVTVDLRTCSNTLSASANVDCTCVALRNQSGFQKKTSRRKPSVRIVPTHVRTVRSREDVYPDITWKYTMLRCWCISKAEKGARKVFGEVVFCLPFRLRILHWWHSALDFRAVNSYWQKL